MEINWNIILAALEIILIAMQYKLSRKIDKQSQKKERGYFILQDSNLVKKSMFESSEYKDVEYCNHVRYLYDLDGALPFWLRGNSDVFVNKRKIMVNNRIVENEDLLDLFVSVIEQNECYGIIIPLNETEKKQKFIDVTIDIYIKSVLGCKYREIIILKFEKSPDELWRLVRRMIKFIDEKW